ncbi:MULTISPECIES: hypothetical protein [unclassified Spirosoma]|uniref:hypothetical protein n=1 Tax=unclassified Spirosoma TaxID=2621999 RepID=UPI001ACCBED0|nr:MULTISPECIES: hypothetical protein [unclassified Spirosoma]MBN8821049.1 hypothetical protein [Spirosoma sp.]
MTSEELTKDQRRERSLAIARRMLANKKAAEQEAIEDYKNNPAKQALVAELDRKNAEAGTPIVRLPIHP